MQNFHDLVGYALHKPDIARALAGQFGLDQKQTDSVTQMLISAIAGGLLANIQREGAAPLNAALENGAHEKLLEKAKTPGENLFNVMIEGNAILGHILGSKDTSRKVASAIEQKTNVEATIIKTMLPVIAAIVMGMMANTQRNLGRDKFTERLSALPDTGANANILDDLLRLVGSLK